ncbi:DUF3348 domain-containing protein [Rhodoferax sp.]|uniref:DUF3348 domain-containing protein n=1 Tax=Rhodoferax sp. TaxID=50421 RepID=UPI00262B8C53|nr:DUF3348 domain-containing protein [Rhodoferax sp.]MDD2925960.1 DUF3348 domain-containing protein [Rhodoferax sp.]
MTRVLTRTHFHGSKLIRVLTELALVDAIEPETGFAEKLGQWLSLNDAITLHAAHAPAPTSPLAPAAGSKSAQSAAIGQEFTRIRTSLVNSITRIGTPKGGRTRLERPALKPGDPLDTAIAYEPYRRDHVARQRDMELSIRPLRSRVREVLARASPALRQLAGLDAVFDAILSERENKLLGTLPSLLERRFEQLFKTHQQTLAERQQADNPALWLHEGAWLARFGHELQTVLLAELDLRLQPTLGLIEAFNNKTTPHP